MGRKNKVHEKRYRWLPDCFESFSSIIKMPSTLESYYYASTLLLKASFFFLFVFGCYHFLSGDPYRVNKTQVLLTLSLSLIILAYIIRNGFPQREGESLFFYSVYILGFPLLYHLMFLMFFSNDNSTKQTFIKVYIALGGMLYLTLIWYNLKNIVQENDVNASLFDLLTLYKSKT